MRQSGTEAGASDHERELTKIRICVLPVAGLEWPGQMLMMQATNQSRDFEMRHGVHTRFFAATRTCLKYHPDILYFDWIARYIVGRTRLVTFLKIAAFWLDVQIATKIFRRPIVWSLHNLQSHERSANSRWEMAMQRYFATHCAFIRVFSEGALERAQQLLGVARGKLRVVPMGHYIDYYPNRISTTEARARLGFVPGDFVLLWLGSIRPYKGLLELIEAFQQVAPPHWRLVIAGKPYIESYAREIALLVRADARIQLHDRFIPDEELQVFYNAADVVTLPFVMVENTASLVVAMGFRKPVLAPNLGVIGERLNRQPELVYEPGGLVAALEKLVQTPSAHLAEMGEANFVEARRYDWDDLNQVFREIFQPASNSITQKSI
jgi:glycosyltransferase involved in cell wall biosynthesis